MWASIKLDNKGFVPVWMYSIVHLSTCTWVRNHRISSLSTSFLRAGVFVTVSGRGPKRFAPILQYKWEQYWVAGIVMIIREVPRHTESEKNSNYIFLAGNTAIPTIPWAAIVETTCTVVGLLTAHWKLFNKKCSRSWLMNYIPRQTCCNTDESARHLSSSSPSSLWACWNSRQSSVGMGTNHAHLVVKAEIIIASWTKRMRILSWLRTFFWGKSLQSL